MDWDLLQLLIYSTKNNANYLLLDLDGTFAVA
jgi:hypothetical protein